MKLESMVDKISLGDCYELIKKIPDKSIDCVYIDIPYLYDENGGSYSELGKRIQKIDKQDLSGINRGIDYSIFNEIKRVLKKINVFVWCSKLQIRDILNISIWKVFVMKFWFGAKVIQLQVVTINGYLILNIVFILEKKE